MSRLAFLTDEHVAPAVAREARRKCHGIAITAFRDWRGGAFLGVADETVLTEAARDGLTLVTYDQRTIRPLLKQWAETGISHSGIVFVDHRTIAPQNIGALVTSLSLLWKSEKDADWKNRVLFLTGGK